MSHNERLLSVPLYVGVRYHRYHLPVLHHLLWYLPWACFEGSSVWQTNYNAWWPHSRRGHGVNFRNGKINRTVICYLLRSFSWPGVKSKSLHERAGPRCYSFRAEHVEVGGSTGHTHNPLGNRKVCWSNGFGTAQFTECGIGDIICTCSHGFR